MATKEEVFALARGLVGGIEGTDKALEHVYGLTARSILSAHVWSFAKRSALLNVSVHAGFGVSISFLVDHDHEIYPDDEGYLSFSRTTAHGNTVHAYAIIENASFTSLLDELGNDVLPLWEKDDQGNIRYGPLHHRATLRVRPADASGKMGWVIPPDALRIIGLYLNDESVPFEVRGDLIFSEEASGQETLIYTIDVSDDPEQWSPDFAEAVATKMAAGVAWSLTESRTLTDSLSDRAEVALRRARSSDRGMSTVKSFPIRQRQGWLDSRRNVR